MPTSVFPPIRSSAVAIMLLLLVLFSSADLAGLEAAEDPLEGLDEFVLESMEIWNVPGVAVAVVKDDQLAFAKGFGLRQVGTSARVDADTIFPIASNTKALTAATVAIAVDEGKLAWDDPVRRYLPNFSWRSHWKESVTLKDLLSFSTTGRFAYRGSGEGYDVATEMLAAATGIGWLEYMESRLLRPLSMTYRKSEDMWDPDDVRRCRECLVDGGRTVRTEEARVDNITMLHVDHEGVAESFAWLRHRQDMRDMVGGFSASARELSRWMQMLLNGGTFEGHRILSPEVVDDLLSVQVSSETPKYPEVGEGSGNTWGYGFGWHITDYLGRRAAVHGGTLIGARSVIALMPKEKLGVAVLVNRMGGSTGLGNNLPEIVAFEVFDAYLGAPRKNRNAARATAERGLWRRTFHQDLEDYRLKGTRPSLPLTDYVGQYLGPQLDPRGRRDLLTIGLEGEHLTYLIEREGEGYLDHWHLDVFSQRSIGPLRQNGGFFSFVLGPTGKVEAVRFTLQHAPFHGPARVFERVK